MVVKVSGFFLGGVYMIPVSLGQFAPPPLVISPSLGQIPRNRALPARPPLGIPLYTWQSSHLKIIFLYLDAATNSASELSFGILFDNRFTGVREPILSDFFKSWI